MHARFFSRLSYARKLEWNQTEPYSRERQAAVASWVQQREWTTEKDSRNILNGQYGISSQLLGQVALRIFRLDLAIYVYVRSQFFSLFIAFICQHFPSIYCLLLVVKVDRITHLQG